MHVLHSQTANWAVGASLTAVLIAASDEEAIPATCPDAIVSFGAE